MSGMKGPLTLQLTPRSLADVETSPPLNRSTFGFHEPQNTAKEFAENRYSTRQDSKYTRLPLPIRTQYRDTPIYLEPGSPLLSNFPLSPPSSCDGTVDECNSPNTEVDEHYETMVNPPLFCRGKTQTDMIQSAINAGQETDHRECTNSWASIPTDISRDSALSFQCMGEPLVPNEAAWFRSPSERCDGNFSRPRPGLCRLVLSRSMPETRKVESWLSDASISDDDEDDVLVSLPIPTF